MAQNNSVFVFVWKTSDDSCGSPNRRIDMNQVTNPKSLGFTWKKIANLQGVSICFWSLHFCNRLFCCRQFCKTSICISCCRSRWFTCTNPMKLSVFISTLSSLVLGNSLSNTYWTDGFWFYASAHLPCSQNL